MSQEKSSTSLKEQKDETTQDSSNTSVNFLNDIYLSSITLFSSINSDLKKFSRPLECQILNMARRSGLHNLTLEVEETNDGHCLKISEQDLQHFTDIPSLDCSQNLASFFQEVGLERIVLDTKLQCNQFSDVIKLLWGLRKILNRPDAGRMDATTGTKEEQSRPVSRLSKLLGWEDILHDLYSTQGLNAYCARTIIDRDTKTLSIGYSYCETTFSRIVKEYKQRDDFFKDHRAFFRVAPRYAIVFACLTLLPLLSFVVSMEWPGSNLITVFLAFLSATVATLVGFAVFVFFQTVGAIEYDKEIQAEKLEKAYLELNDAHRRIQSDLDTARNIQQTLLPSLQETPFQDMIAIATSFIPAASVGGDYFDFKKISDRELAIIFADVSGHGLSAAYITGIIKTIFESNHKTNIQNQNGAGPSFMRKLNRFLITMTPTESYATTFYGIYNIETNTLRYINAGHSPLPIIARREPPKIIHLDDAQWLPVGIVEDCKYEPAEMQLVEYDKLFLCTDGITEAWNTKGEQFGEKRLSKILESLMNESVQESVQGVLQAARDFAGGEPQHDDITLMAMEVKGR